MPLFLNIQTLQKNLKWANTHTHLFFEVRTVMTKHTTLHYLFTHGQISRYLILGVLVGKKLTEQRREHYSHNFGGIQYTKQWYSNIFHYQIHTIYIDIIKCFLQYSRYLINIRLFNTYSRFIVLLDSQYFQIHSIFNVDDYSLN